MTALVARWRVVGPGFGWLAGSVVTFLGGLGWLAGGGWIAAIATAASAGGVALAGRPNGATVAFAAAALFYGLAAVPDGGIATVSGALALGGISGEMLLGHWYLIDPQLPRRALQRLDVVALVGVVLESVFLLVAAGRNWEDAVIGWAFVVLAATSLILMVAVWFSLKEPSYPGVMAATGLSYLATLTAVGAAVAGRALVDEGTSLFAGTAMLAGTLVAS